MADPAGLDSIRCETDRGVPIDPHDVPRAVLAGHIRRIVVDSNGHVIDYGREKRLFEGPARDAAGWSHVDHNKEWGDDGETNQNNAGVLCAKHNTT